VNITDAKPAPRFVRIPAAVMEAALKAEAAGENRVGKGHIVTLARLAQYLWSDQPLEGTTAEWCEVLGVNSRSWQRHIPELAFSGVCRYVQPQLGYWRIFAFPESREDVALLRQAWQQVLPEIRAGALRSHEATGEVDAIFMRLRATKLSHPVVVASLSNQEEKVFEDLSSSAVEQQQQASLQSEGGAGGNGSATKLSHRAATELSPELVEAMEVLAGVGVQPQALRQTLAETYGLERILDVVDYAEIQKVGNRAGYVRRALEEGWEVTLEAQDEEEGVNPDRYVEGPYAAFVQH
jgi:hypothetical protein